MSTKDQLEKLIESFSPSQLRSFFEHKSLDFKPIPTNLDHYADEHFEDFQSPGYLDLPEGKVLLLSAKTNHTLNERSGKKLQYENAKEILKDLGSESEKAYEAGIFTYYDPQGNFRFSLIYPEYQGTKRSWNNFRRFSYYVNKDYTNKTFLKQIGETPFATISSLRNAFSIVAVTNLFYDEFFKIYDQLVQTTKSINHIEEEPKVRDFVLLFTIRTIFIGFIQKRKWIGNNDKFIQSFLKEYQKRSKQSNTFYSNWLSILFFEALNSPVGRPITNSDHAISPDTATALQMTPYLNGGLFKVKPGFDDQHWNIPDQEINAFFEFLFAHSFTIEENSLEDEDLQLNPEFLGIIFERLVNKADGAVYTPRTEVDLMCRLSLLKWLQKNLDHTVKVDNLYELFFKESEKEDEQKQGSFSRKEAIEILEKLQSITICDPAVGSGAFLVGMMQVLDEIEQSLKQRYQINGSSVFDRKKEIIKNCLYGVEVKEWAVWICQLRLWLSLFVDTPEDLKDSPEPILPSLDFKVRQGDSLVQRVGTKAFPVTGHEQSLKKGIKDSITKLKNMKMEYFDNRSQLKEWELKQRELAIYRQIIDEEIKSIQYDLNVLLGKSEDIKIQLFHDKGDLTPKEQSVMAKQCTELTEQLNELQEQKKALSLNDKPLVWSIEFAEIFADKGGFDLIIGNPPYVRQEKIEDPTGKEKDKKDHKSFLAEMVKLDFPDDFNKSSKINAKSDLFAYFYIRSLRLLNSKGIHTFICSNSWLDVGYGSWLQEFLLKRCPIEMIIDNQAKRSFEAADVNTIISIIHAPIKGKKSQNHDEHIVKFVAFKKPFDESIYTENLLKIEYANEIQKNEVLRVFPIPNKELWEAGIDMENDTGQKLAKAIYIGDKWGGKYLRAPDIFFTILEKGKGKLVKLKEIAEVRFGIKTGKNEFFYLTEEQAKHWGIEDEFLKAVILSPRECKSISIDLNDLKTLLFACNKSKDELKNTNAIKYIEWGEKQKNKDGIAWNDVPSVKNRKRWWNIGDIHVPFCCCPLVNNVRLVFFKSNGIPNDANLVSIFPKRHYNEELLITLNSTYNMINLELLGISNLGEGAIKLNPTYIKESIILNPDQISNAKLIKRPLKSIFEECGIDPKSEIPIDQQEPKPLPDRAELDNIVFDALGLTEEERKEVYRAVCQLVWNRISKARSV
ncbi:MAG TPA: Eco57I restriction-modification methylase domain-containing protein [Caldisericia bacterium]|nr:Eco57I restriction-modification methylase domain-containing protein [Caldisericia bacterium]